MEDRKDKDTSLKHVPTVTTGENSRIIPFELLKTAYIAEGLSVQQLAERYTLSVDTIQKVIEDAQLPELRRVYIREGVAKIQNEQLGQAQKLLDLELNFKKMRLLQLEKILEDFMAYFGRHGDFYKRHPVSGEILRDTDGIPMHVHVPNVSREIQQIKESVTLSDGLKKLLTELDDIINGKPKGEAVGDNVIEMDEFDGLFKKRV